MIPTNSRTTFHIRHIHGTGKEKDDNIAGFMKGSWDISLPMRHQALQKILRATEEQNKIQTGIDSKDVTRAQHVADEVFKQLVTGREIRLIHVDSSRETSSNACSVIHTQSDTTITN